MSNELAIIEDISEEKWPEIYGVGKVNYFYEKVKLHVSQEVPDVTTAKGRAAIASNSGKVSSSKTAVEKPGRAYLKKIKELPKSIETELREFVDLMDKLRDDTRQPLTDWEAEQARIAEAKILEDLRIAEEKRLADEAAALLIKIEDDHELALLLYADHVRKQEEAAKAAEQLRIDNENRIAREAAELATELANKAAEKLILDAKLEKERAEKEKLQAEAREKQAKIDSDARELKLKEDAEKATKIASDKAESDRVKAIEDERARVAAENARLARIKQEEEAAAARQAANKAHQKKINNELLDDLIEIGCNKELGVKVVKALANHTLRHAQINY